MLLESGMTPCEKIRRRAFGAALAIALLLSAPGAPAAWAEAPDAAGAETAQEDRVPFPIRFYQRYISAADGDRCPMYPSDSAYAAQAIERHGWLKGWIMAADRLMRCGRDETRLSPAVNVDGRRRTYDPLEANDLWKAEP